MKPSFPSDNGSRETQTAVGKTTLFLRYFSGHTVGRERERRLTRSEGVEERFL